MRRLSVVIAAVASLAAAGHAAAATYYVSPNGNDASAGTSVATPWRTVGKVDSTRFAPGDSILFQGGSSFGDATLMPSTSGTAAAPITFSSYGGGRATISNASGAVWFSGASYLVFDNLDLTTAGSNYGVFAGSGGGASDHITLRNSVVHDSGSVGLISPTHGDSAWTVENNTFDNLGDSALIILGSDCVVRGNTISDVGTNTSITYGKHGVYAKGPDMTIANNDISRVNGGQAVSIRFHGARVYGNRVHDTSSAFAFFDYDTAPAPQGTSYIYDNLAWNITGYGFYYDNQADPNGVLPTVDFVVASNTFQFSSASEAVNVSPSGSAHVTLANNIFTGSYGSGLRGAPTTVESHDDWFGAGSNVPANAGDTTAVPSLSSAPALALPLGSPLIDRGAALGQLAYTGSCDGSPLSYCGSAPDLGAVESAPSIINTLAPPSNLVASNVTAAGLSLEWTASPDPRTIGYRVSENGADIGAASSTSSSVGSLACGTTYAFSVVAVDVGGTVSAPAGTSASTGACPVAPPAPLRTPVDTTPPTLTITNPAANASVPLSLAIAATASDASGVARLAFSVDGATRCTVTTAPYVCAVQVTAGRHTIAVQAIDTAGNAAVASIVVSATKHIRTLAQISVTPSSGSNVPASFVAHARARLAKGRALVFELDGRARCVDRRAPYACAIKAAQGVHRLAVRAGGNRSPVVRLRVR